MPAADVVAILSSHGCGNLTEFMDESACSEFPVTNGGVGDVFRGKLIDGTSVAIKVVRANYEPRLSTRMYHKQAAREIYTWSKCNHPNVVQLIGFAEFRDSLAMISRWEDNGSLLQFLSNDASADRCQLSKSICAGLAYLHDNGIVHGDLKGANILIAQDGRPMLMDFGNANMLSATVLFAPNSKVLPVSLRWTAPEILEGKTKQTFPGDVYSLGMTILECFTSKIPFPNQVETAVATAVMIFKMRPTRPENVIPKKSIYGDQLWATLLKCWSHEPKNRPSVKQVWDSMEPITPKRLQEIQEYERGLGQDEA